MVGEVIKTLEAFKRISSPSEKQKPDDVWTQANMLQKTNVLYKQVLSATCKCKKNADYASRKAPVSVESVYIKIIDLLL